MAASQRSSTAAAAASASPPPASQPPATTTAIPARIHISYEELAHGIATSNEAYASRLCDEYMLRLEELKNEPDMAAVLNDTAFDMRVPRRLFEKLHECCTVSPPNPLNLVLIEKILGSLHATFDNKVIARHLDHSTIDHLLGVILDLLLSTRANEQNLVIKTINAVTMRLIDNADTSAVFEALIDRLERESENYLSKPSQIQLKYVELVARCIVRITPLALNMDLVIIKSHNFLAAFPPSSFRDKDDIPIRTIKTLLSSATKRYGDALRQRCAALVGINTLVFSFINLCLNQLAAQEGGAATAPTTATRYADPTATTAASGQAGRYSTGSYASSDAGSSSTSAAALTNVATNVESDPVATMFAKVRKHQTSDIGLKELYEYLKQHPNCPEFRVHYNRCSEAFRAFIDRNMERRQREEAALEAGGAR